MKLLMHVKIAHLLWEFQRTAKYHRGNSWWWDLVSWVSSNMSLLCSLLDVIKSLYIYKKRLSLSRNTWDFCRQISSYEKLLFSGRIRIHINVLYLQCWPYPPSAVGTRLYFLYLLHQVQSLLKLLWRYAWQLSNPDVKQHYIFSSSNT